MPCTGREMKMIGSRVAGKTGVDGKISGWQGWSSWDEKKMMMTMMIMMMMMMMQVIMDL